METTLHRQLKLHYAADDSQTEVAVDGFRIDAIDQAGHLIEIQHASLSALRVKTRKLLSDSQHHLRVIKPILARKRIITVEKQDGPILRNRMSPKRGELLDLYMDLVYFCSEFPHPRLTLEFPLIEAEEWRIDRKRPTRRGKRYRTLDQKLVSVNDSPPFRQPRDLLAHLPLQHLPKPFDTAELAAAIGRPRWYAQKVAYCLRNVGAIHVDSKRGNNILYRLSCRMPRGKSHHRVKSKSRRSAA